VLYHHKIGDKVTLDDNMTRYYEATKRLATQLLMHAQMVLPQQRWVKQTVAVSHLAALFVNELWSHEDPDCIERMKRILWPAEADQTAESSRMPFPELRLIARTVLADELERDVAGSDWSKPCTCLPGQLVTVQIELTRGHAGQGEAGADLKDLEQNPKGILEAYWVYIEGHTPQGSTLLGAQPVTVSDLSTTTLPAMARFEAPKEAGEYAVTVHIASTSVVGCDQTMGLKFIVQEDDVPALE